MTDALRSRLLAAEQGAVRPAVLPIRIADLAARARRRTARRAIVATAAALTCAVVWPWITPSPPSAERAVPDAAFLRAHVDALLRATAPDVEREHAWLRATERAHVRAFVATERAAARERALTARIREPK